jgi:hypothetical protein
MVGEFRYLLNCLFDLSPPLFLSKKASPLILRGDGNPLLLLYYVFA